MLNRLTKWLNIERVINALKLTGDRDAWNLMIHYAKEQGTAWLVPGHNFPFNYCNFNSFCHRCLFSIQKHLISLQMKKKSLHWCVCWMATSHFWVSINRPAIHTDLIGIIPIFCANLVCFRFSEYVGNIPIFFQN